MEQRSRKRYDAEFKRQSLELWRRSGRSASSIEQELGLYQHALRTWQKELESDPKDAFPGTGHLKPADDELRRLQRENAVLREERDILKKAMAVFTRPPQTGMSL
jgi:transposase